MIKPRGLTSPIFRGLTPISLTKQGLRFDWCLVTQLITSVTFEAVQLCYSNFPSFIPSLDIPGTAEKPLRRLLLSIVHLPSRDGNIITSNLLLWLEDSNILGFSAPRLRRKPGQRGLQGAGQLILRN
jgi:hypothetical protein